MTDKIILNNRKSIYIGCCHIELGEFQRAREVFAQLILDAPGWERPCFNMGRAYLREGDKSSAYEWFKKAELINPDSEDCLYYLGVYYDAVGNDHMAMEYYKRSISANCFQAETHLNLGVCYFNQKNIEEAMHELEAAHSIDSDCSAILYNQARIFMEVKEYQRALEKFSRCIRQKPEDIDCMTNIVRCYIKLEKPDMAVDWNDKILSAQPENKVALAAKKKLESTLEK